MKETGKLGCPASPAAFSNVRRDGCRGVAQLPPQVVEFRFFDDDDQALFEILARGEFNISGMRNKDLRENLHDKTCSQVSRILKRLRVHGLLKRAGSSYKYYLTRIGRLVLLAGLKLRELFLVPQLASQPAL